MTIVAQ
jgi:hypothetical protein